MWCIIGVTQCILQLGFYPRKVKCRPRVRAQFRDDMTSMPGRWERSYRQQVKQKWKRGRNLQFHPVRKETEQEIQEVTVTELIQKEWGAWCYVHRGPHSMHTFCCKHGRLSLQICAAAQRQGRGRLTEESAISLRVWSDPTAKIILASGETVTQL